MDRACCSRDRPDRARARCSARSRASGPSARVRYYSRPVSTCCFCRSAPTFRWERCARACVIPLAPTRSRMLRSRKHCSPLGCPIWCRVEAIGQLEHAALWRRTAESGLRARFADKTGVAVSRRSYLQPGRCQPDAVVRATDAAPDGHDHRQHCPPQRIGRLPSPATGTAGRTGRSARPSVVESTAGIGKAQSPSQILSGMEALLHERLRIFPAWIACAYTRPSPVS